MLIGLTTPPSPTKSRAGLSQFYTPQCGGSGPTGRCVRLSPSAHTPTNSSFRFCLSSCTIVRRQRRRPRVPQIRQRLLRDLLHPRLHDGRARPHARRQRRLVDPERTDRRASRRNAHGRGRRRVDRARGHREHVAECRCRSDGTRGGCRGAGGVLGGSGVAWARAAVRRVGACCDR